MTHRRFFLSAAVACAALVGCRSASPDSAARQYEQRRITGDLAEIPPLILPTEAQALAGNAASLKDAGLTEMGVPSATVDSAHVTRQAGDSATVQVYLTAPNAQAMMGDLFARAISGQLDTSAKGVRRALASAPRVTVIDTVLLLRVGKEWKVSLRLTDRHTANQATKALHDAFVNDDLRAAAVAAKSILAVQSRSPGIADTEDIAKAREAVIAQNLIDSVDADLVVERGFLGSALRGYVRNLSGTRIVDLVLKVQDVNGGTQKVSVHRLDPRDRKAVFELAGSLAAGRPASVRIAWVNLGAWESLGF